jgi:hypothetical protein
MHLLLRGLSCHVPYVSGLAGRIGGERKKNRRRSRSPEKPVGIDKTIFASVKRVTFQKDRSFLVLLLFLVDLAGATLPLSS